MGEAVEGRTQSLLGGKTSERAGRRRGLYGPKIRRPKVAVATKELGRQGERGERKEEERTRGGGKEEERSNTFPGKTGKKRRKGEDGGKMGKEVRGDQEGERRRRQKERRKKTE